MNGHAAMRPFAADDASVSPSFELQHVAIHGHDVAYRTGGTGPVIVLVHGMAGSSATWLDVMPGLTENFTVVAPDLLGHGASAKPRTDYSLGAYASGLRDLLDTLGHDRATVIGHSLGGGIVMQFAYQFPERCERIVLVSSGGLGEEVSFVLRALTLPGVEFLLPVMCARQLHDAGTVVIHCLNRLGLRPAPHLDEIWESYGSLADAETRTAFVQTLRAVIDPAGQRVSATNRLYLASDVPTLIVWGDRGRDYPGRAFPSYARGNSSQPARDLRRCRALPAPRAPGLVRRGRQLLHGVDITGQSAGSSPTQGKPKRALNPRNGRWRQRVTRRLNGLHTESVFDGCRRTHAGRSHQFSQRVRDRIRKVPHFGDELRIDLDAKVDALFE